MKEMAFKFGTIIGQLLVFSSAVVLVSCSSPPETFQPSPTEIPMKASEADAGKVVLAFYRQYTAYPGNPLVTRAYRDNPTLSGYLTEQWQDDVDEVLASFTGQGGGFDPFTCAQDWPSDFSVVRKDCGEGECVVTLQTVFSGNASGSFEVEMVEVDGSWLVNEVQCMQPEAESEPSAGSSRAAQTSQSDGLEWYEYSSTRWGFSLQIPGGWEAVEEELFDRSPNDPVSGYVHLFAEDGYVPVSLVISSASPDSFRAVFPEPEGDPAVWPGSRHVLAEEHFGGELYLILLHPEADDFRVCFRVVNPVDDLNRALEETLSRMIESFTFSGEA